MAQAATVALFLILGLSCSLGWPTPQLPENYMVTDGYQQQANAFPSQETDKSASQNVENTQQPDGTSMREGNNVPTEQTSDDDQQQAVVPPQLAVDETPVNSAMMVQQESIPEQHEPFPQEIKPAGDCPETEGTDPITDEKHIVICTSDDEPNDKFQMIEPGSQAADNSEQN